MSQTKLPILNMDNKSKYLGMTVNERLYVSELSGKYDKAVKNKDTETAISILKAVDLGEENIKAILKSDGLINDDAMNNMERPQSNLQLLWKYFKIFLMILGAATLIHTLYFLCTDFEAIRGFT